MDVSDVSRPVDGGVEVHIMVSPNSDRKGADGTNEWRKRLIIRVCSPPLDGKANREAEEFMKELTGCRSEIIKGHANRQKTIMIYGNAEEILRSLRSCT